MGIFLTDQPHPAEAMRGHTRRVTLTGGEQVLIRRIDVEATTLDAVLHVMNATSLLNTAAAHAEEASAVAASISEIPARSSSLTPAQELETALEVSKRVLRTALVQPRLEELVAAYGGRADLSDPDLGLGADYRLLVNAVNEFSAPDEGEGDKTERFPGEVGGDGGQSGPTVQPQAKRRAAGQRGTGGT